MERKKEESLLFKYVKIVLVVALYWVVSIAMVFVNKTLLGGAAMKPTDAPLFITWFQCVVTVALCYLGSHLTKTAPHLFSFPDLGTIDMAIVRQVLPLSFIFVGMISTNNFCLKYLGVAFYYMGRSLTTIFNVIFTFLILGQKTSLPALMSCVVIMVGFWIGVDQENVAGSLSIVGVIFGVAASVCVSLNAIFTKKVLPAVDESLWKLSYYNNVIAAFLFLPLMLVVGEGPAIWAILTGDKSSPAADSLLTFWSLMVVGGVCGFAIGYVTGLQIQVTSPLTSNISGTAKACAQTVLAMWWYDDHRPVLWWLSNWVVLAGSMAYTRIKQLEMKRLYNSKPLPVDEEDVEELQPKQSPLPTK